MSLLSQAFFMMKIRFVTTLFLVFWCVAFPVYSQNELVAGVRIGANFSDIAVTNYINTFAEPQYQMKTGLHAGAFASVPLVERFRFATELLYSNKGMRANERVNLHYVNVPFLVQYELSERFFVEIGPELGYLFSARSGGENASNVWNNKLDIGLDAGLHMKWNDLTLGIRYYAGFSSVINGIDESATNFYPMEERIKYQNRSLQLSAAINLFRY